MIRTAYHSVGLIFFLGLLLLFSGCEQNSNANLSGIYVAYHQLSPDFKQDVLQYSVEANYSVSEVEFTATGDESGQTIKINGEPVPSGLSRMVPLEVGDNQFEIQVTASDKATQQTYQVTITRLDEAASGITVHVQQPANWENVFMWFDQHVDGSWETHTLGEPPGDMEAYRTGWYRKFFADTETVEFIFNDGVTWDHKIGAHPDDTNFIANSDVWIVLEEEIQPGRWTGTISTVDPEEN